VLQDARRTLAEVQAIRSGGSGRVRIGAMPVATAALVPAAVLRLRERAPGIELSLVQDIAAGLWLQFERDELDLLVTRLDAPHARLRPAARRLFADQHQVVCRPAHPLAPHRAWPGETRCATRG
jgi:DNA-binding transcriptional LysR family regulator